MLQDRLLDAQVRLRDARRHAAVMIVTGIPGAGRSEVVNELLAWLDPKLVTVFGFGRRTTWSASGPCCGATGGRCRHAGAARSCTAAGTRKPCWLRPA